MKNVDDLITQKIAYKADLEQQIDSLQKHQILLQNKQTALLTSYHETNGALAALQEIKTKLEPAEEGT